MKTRLAKAQGLAQQATRIAEWRGHELCAFHWEETPSTFRIIGSASCTTCEKGVVVNTDPVPNDIDISGQAIALNCTE
jgi:hypothetical protein